MRSVIDGPWKPQYNEMYEVDVVRSWIDVGGVALCIPVYTNAGQAKNHVNQQVAVFYGSADLTVGTLRKIIAEIIMNLPNLDASAKSELEHRLTKAFNNLDFIGKVTVAQELDVAKATLGLEDRLLFEGVILSGLQTMNDRERSVFQSDRGSKALSSAAAQLALTSAQLQVANAKSSQMAELARWSSLEQAAETESHASAMQALQYGGAYCGAVGGGAGALGAACCMTNPATAAIVAAGAIGVVIGGTAGGAAGYNLAYNKVYRKHQPAIEAAKTSYNTATKALTNVEHNVQAAQQGSLENIKIVRQSLTER